MFEQRPIDLPESGTGQPEVVPSALDPRSAVAPAGGRSGGPSDPRRRFLAVLLIVSAIVAGVTWWVASETKSPRQIAAEAGAPAPSSILAPVERRVLERVVAVRGKVVAPETTKVVVAASSSGGAPVVTAAPLAAGALVEEGAVVAEIALRPVIVLAGPIPMFRDLELGSEGRDVLQLQQALDRLGLVPDTGGVLGPATAAAVARLYAGHGYAAPNPDPTATGRGGRRPVVLRSELAFVGSLPARLAGRPPHVGQTAGKSIARLTGGGLFARALVTVADRDQIRPGARASIRVLGVRVPGRVASIGAVERRRGSDLQAYPVRVQPRAGALPRRALGRDAQIAIASARTRGRTLVVPLAAVSSAADGSARLTRVRGDQSSVVTIRPGLSANGFVAVHASAADLRAGDQVVVGRR
jgi:peptidoglycan hydrolase-like protein with peptidoglycan-binding domain